MANTLYRQGSHEQAKKHLDKIKDAAVASPAAADYYYNLGNVAVALEDYQTAVDAYKQSLLRNPGDLEAKENYIYAKEKLKQQQDQQQNQQNDQNQDQNQEQQNQDQNQNKDQQDQNNDQNKDNQDQNKDQNKDQNQDQQNQSGSEPKISPQAAQQMLQAIQAKEKETQDKVNKEKAAALSSRKKDKNW